MDSENKNNDKESRKFRSREHFFKKFREINSLYKDAYTKNQHLIEQVGLLEHEITELRKKVADLEGALILSKKYEGYNCGWKQIQKILFILESNGSAMSSSELLKALLALEPKFKDTWRNPQKSICRIIGRAIKHGLIIRYSTHRGFKYDLLR